MEDVKITFGMVVSGLVFSLVALYEKGIISTIADICIETGRMMKMKNYKRIEELNGFRKPNEQEKDFIGRYFEKIFQYDKKVSMGLAVILWVAGGFALVSIMVCGITAAIISMGFFIAAFLATKHMRDNEKKIQAFKNGEFRVLDGTATEISTNMEYPGCCNVRFCSKHGELLKLMCTVRVEGLQEGTPLLLAYADDTVVKGGIFRAFTPYMLTEDGLKHYL